MLNNHIVSLLQQLESDEKSGHKARLIDLGDAIDHNRWSDEDFKLVVRKLIQFLATENDWNLLTPAFRILSHAYMREFDLVDISFKPLIEILHRSDPNFVGSVLYILSMTYQKKYIPVVQEYLMHEDASVRSAAEDALDYLEGI